MGGRPGAAARAPRRDNLHGAGGTIGQRLRLGGEIIAWVNEEGHAVESLSSVLLVARFYPLSAAGLYLKGGVGLGRGLSGGKRQQDRDHSRSISIFTVAMITSAGRAAFSQKFSRASS